MMLLNHLLGYLLVAARIGGFVALAPVLGTIHLSIRLRIALVLGIAIAVTPLVAAHPALSTANGPELAIALGGEALLGAAFGLATATLLAGVRLAGEYVGQLSGLQMAEALDIESEGSSAVLPRLMECVAIVVFLLIGGHRLATAALLDSFQWFPAGAVGAPADLGSFVGTLLADSFSVAIRVALPALAAILVATLLIGFLSRTLPQLGVMNIGVVVNAVLGLGALAVSLSAVVWILEDQLEPMLELAAHAWKG